MKNKKAFFISLAAVICIAAIALAVYFTLSAETNNSQQTQTSSISDHVEDDSWKSGTATHEKILSYTETHNDTFAQNYAGMYFDSSGKLNILLTGKKKECNKFILDTFGYENPCKTIVKYSYKELTSEQDKINNLVTDNINTQNKKDSVLNAVTSVSLNVLDNNISVTLYTQTGETDNELISKFKDEVSDSEMIAFEFSNRKTVNFVN